MQDALTRLPAHVTDALAKVAAGEEVSWTYHNRDYASSWLDQPRSMVMGVRTPAARRIAVRMESLTSAGAMAAFDALNAAALNG